MKPIISIKVRLTDYSGLVTLGNHVLAGLTGNVNYTTPLPTLMALQTAITDVEDAITAWGPPGDRGSHAALLDLRAKAVTLYQTIKSLSQYAQNTAQTAAGSDYLAMAAILGTSGFEVVTSRQPQGVLQAVRNFHRGVSPQVNVNQVKLMWRKPLGLTTAGNVKSYSVMRGTTPVLSEAVQIGSTTRTSFVDTNDTGAVQTWYYWVIPVNTAGNGTASEALSVSLVSN